LLCCLLVCLSLKGYAELTFDSLKSYYETKLSNKASRIEESELSVKLDNANALIEEVEELSHRQFILIIEAVAFAESNDHLEEAKELLEKAALVLPLKSLERGFSYYLLAKYARKKEATLNQLTYYLKAATIFEERSDYYGLLTIYSSIAIINFRSGNNEIALDFTNQAYEQLLNNGISKREDSTSLSLIYSLRGIINRYLGEYDIALYNIDKSITISKALGDSLNVAISMGNKAMVYYENGELQKAADLLKYDFSTSLRNQQYESAFNAGITLCDIYLKLEKEEKLDSLFQRIMDIKNNTKVSPIKSQLLSFYQMASNYYAFKNTDSLLTKYKLLTTALATEIDSINRLNELGKLQEKYLMEKEINKLELLQKTNELQSSRLQLRTALLAIVGFILIVVLFYVYVLRNKNGKIDRLNEMLEAKVSERTNRLIEINKELDNYLYRASHDIRRPIRTLLGLNNVMKFTDDPAELKMLFSKVHDTALNMDEILFKLQMAYELNNEHALEKVKIEDILKSSLEDLERHISYKKAIINIDLSKKALALIANAALIKIAVDNIIENGLIYHNRYATPEINISTDKGKYYFYIHIQDNGYGIDPIYYEQIFESYFKISNKTQGSGLGLFLARRAISYLNGEIAVESVINQGTKFTIKIPINPK